MRSPHHRPDSLPRLTLIVLALISAGAALLLSAAGVRAAGIDDGAHLFSPAALAQAAGQIEQIRQDTGRDVEVVTVTTLANQSIQAVAPGYLAAHPTVDVLLYVSRTDRSLALVVAPGTRRNLSAPEQAAIRDLILTHFAQGNFDLGLVAGVQRVGQDLSATPAGPGSFLGVRYSQLFFLLSGLALLVAFLALVPPSSAHRVRRARWSVESLRNRVRQLAPPGSRDETTGPADEQSVSPQPEAVEQAGHSGASERPH